MSTLDISSLTKELPPGAVKTSEADLAVYSYDAALDRARPDAVAFPTNAEEVRRVVAWCAAHGVAYVARGAGTNLSGGCVPLRGGVVIALSKLDRILEIDTARGLAVVEPGVVNLVLQKELEKQGWFYAPDPASFKVSTLGGNVSENAGGPRCLKYGTTTNHVLALEAVMPDGTLARFAQDDPGCELMSLLIGAEGTLGVITKLWLKIMPMAPRIKTILAGFPSIDAAVECVSAIVASGVLPRVLEAMDRTTVESVEAFVNAGYPKTEAVLLIELDEAIERDAPVVERLCRERGASDLRDAEDAAQREKLWEGRRGAYAAMARLAPNVSVEDGVVPRDKLPEIVRRIKEICARHGLTKTGLLFHAGDGNIHPNVGYDERDKEETARVKAAGHEILQACVELGGSLSGEHGIGLDKRDAMAWLFSPETLALFRGVKRALDPGELANPDKLFPLAEARGGLPFIRPAGPALSPEALFLVEKVRRCAAEGKPMRVSGSGSKLKASEGEGEMIVTASMGRVAELDKPNLTVTVEAGVSMRELHLRLSKEGLRLRLPDCSGTLGGLLATKPHPCVREDLLGMRLLLADGRVVELGGKVVKNVAGYDAARLVLGSWGTLGVILEATFKVFASKGAPIGCGAPQPFAAGPWQGAVKRAFDPRNLLNAWLTGPLT